MNLKTLLCFLIISEIIMPALFYFNLFAQEQPVQKVPKEIIFSGVVTGSDNNVITDGEYTILFSLYTSREGGDPVWSELHEKVHVENGEINVQLGGALSPMSIPLNQEYYLGLKLNGTDELLPRIELVPVPYSIRTLTAENVKDNSISTDKLAPNSITDSKIKSVSWNKIVNTPEIKLEKKPPSTLSKVSVLPLYWRRYGNYLETGQEFLGTVNDRNLVIKTDSIQRMLFDPYGKVIMGTVTDSVFFEVIGKTTLGNTYVKVKMGVGADFNETEAIVHIKSNGIETPFRVDNNNLKSFVIENTGRVEITSKLTGQDDEEGNYPLFINSEDQGLVVKIKSDESNSDHNYMTFWDDDGIAGRIEGMNAGDYLSDPKNIAHDAWFVAQGVALGVAAAATAAGGLEVPDIINGTAEVAYFAFQTTWDLTHLGVTYESGSGDYAEWLEKLNHAEVFNPGEIVGVYGGKISKNTKNAQQIMIVSLSPLVLGNMPEKGEENNFVKVAFKGQVPIKVRGIAHKGDYVIPSGLNDGMGIAVEPELMTAQEFAKTAGRVWEDNSNDEVKFINCAVGMKMNHLVNVLRQSHSENKKLQNIISERNGELDDILNQLNELEKDMKLVNLKIEEMKEPQGTPKFTLNKK